jgi:hypothetical protein
MPVATITITITVDSAEGTTPTVRIGAGDVSAPSPDPDLYTGVLRSTVRRMKGQVSRRFLRDVAEAGLVGKTVTVSDDLAKDYGFNQGLELGGAIGSAASALYKAVDKTREPLERVSKYPSVWRMTEADARIVLAALDA